MRGDRHASFMLRGTTVRGCVTVGVATAADAIRSLAELKAAGVQGVTVRDREGCVLDEAALRHQADLERLSSSFPR